MAKICELHSAKVRNSLVNGKIPPENNIFFSKWLDSSGNNNHGALNSSLFYFDDRSGWLGSYDSEDYYHLYFGLNNSLPTVPSLEGANFPQSAATLFFEINFTEFVNSNACNLFGNNTAINTIMARVQESSGVYGIQLGVIRSNGIWGGLFEVADSEQNRITINTVHKIAIKFAAGASGYIALFIDGVKIGQANITDAAWVPSAQSYKIGNGGAKKKLYYHALYNEALSDEDIIAIQNTEWKIQEPSAALGKTYVAVGDSITWTCADGLNYPELIRQYVNDNYGKIKVLNKGIGGQTSSELLTNKFWNLALSADIVTIGLGMNDCASDATGVTTYKTNLETAIDYLIARNPDVEIILCTPSGTSDENRTPYIADYRTAMQEVATSKGVRICNFHEAVTDSNIGDYSSDGIHPNADGHALLAGLLEPVFDSIL